MARPRFFDRPGNTRQRALVQHVVDPFAGTADGLGIAQIGLAEVDPIENVRQIAALACLEVIESTNRISARYESMREV
jgi:hypothetical protein